MSNSDTEPTPTETRPTSFLGLSDMALSLFGSSSRSAKARVVRMADRGELAAIKVGRRGDRLFPATEIDRLHAEANATRAEVGAKSSPEKK